MQIAGPVNVGSAAVLEVSIVNNGPKQTLSQVAKVRLPGETRFTSSSMNCQEYQRPGGIECSLPATIRVGATLAFTITMDVLARPASGLLVFTGEVENSVREVAEVDPTDNNTAEAQVQVAGP